MNEIEKYYKFDSVNEEKRIVKGLIFPANKKDSDGEWMSPVTIEKMRERFHRLYAQGKADIDLLHNGVAGTGYLLGSEITKSGDWVGEVKIEDETTYELIKEGVLKGFSIYGKALQKSEDGEILDIQLNKISLVENPAHGQAFTVIKEEKNLIRKGIEYLQNLITEDRTMDNKLEDRITTLEKSLTDISTKLTTLTKEKIQEKNIENNENKVENRLTQIEKIQTDIAGQIEYLVGGISQSNSVQTVQKNKKEQSDNELFAFMG